MARITLPISSIIAAMLISGGILVAAETIENPKENKQNNELSSTDHLLCEKQTRGFETALGIPSNYSPLFLWRKLVDGTKKTRYYLPGHGQ